MSALRQHDLNVLIELTSQLVEKIDLDEALEIVCGAALDLFPGEHASVRVLDESGQRLLCGARSGEGRDAKPLTFHIGEGIMGWVVQQGVGTRVDDSRTDPRFKTGMGQGFEVLSLVNVPLVSLGRVLGVLGITASRPRAFDETDERLAVLLANCVSPVIERTRLERLAITDHHTLAYNQRFLFPRLREEISRASRYGLPFSVLLIDLDHFKDVNDEHGHAAGDALLSSFADRLRSLIRLSDVFVRRGGEEFVVIAPNTPVPQVVTMAERIRASLDAEPLSAGAGLEIRQTVSIGVAQWRATEDARQLEARADAAMYKAKSEGRNRVVLSEDE